MTQQACCQCWCRAHKGVLAVLGVQQLRQPLNCAHRTHVGVREQLVPRGQPQVPASESLTPHKHLAFSSWLQVKKCALPSRCFRKACRWQVILCAGP